MHTGYTLVSALHAAAESIISSKADTEMQLKQNMEDLISLCGVINDIASNYLHVKIHWMKYAKENIAIKVRDNVDDMLYDIFQQMIAWLLNIRSIIAEDFIRMTFVKDNYEMIYDLLMYTINLKADNDLTMRIQRAYTMYKNQTVKNQTVIGLPITETHETSTKKSTIHGQGTVTSWSKDKAYGFIQSEYGDIHVKQSSIVDGDYFEVGQPAQFSAELDLTRQTYSATRVYGGIPLQTVRGKDPDENYFGRYHTDTEITETDCARLLSGNRSQRAIKKIRDRNSDVTIMVSNPNPSRAGKRLIAMWSNSRRAVQEALTDIENFCAM